MNSRKSLSQLKFDNQSHKLDDYIVQELVEKKANTKSASLIGPIYDVNGKEIYPTKYRKPKWCSKVE